MSDRALKTKVGALILFSGVLLVGFLVVLGGFSVGAKRTLYIELTDSGSVLSGAPVKIAGVRAGRIVNVEFLVARDARKSAPLKGKAGDHAPINVRITADIDADKAPSVRHDSEFFITTQGVLGEKYLEIAPGTAAFPEWPEGSYVRGNDPPRLDLLFTRADNIMAQVEAALGGDSELNIGELVSSASGVMKKLDGYLERNQARLDAITANLEATTVDGRDLVHALKEGVGSGERVSGIITDARQVMGVLAKDIGPTTASARRTLASAEQAIDVARDLMTENRPHIEAALATLPALAARGQGVLGDAQYIMASLKSGKGTIGQLLTDQEIYDDLKEMLRNLKRHPWKILWRE